MFCSNRKAPWSIVFHWFINKIIISCKLTMHLTVIVVLFLSILFLYNCLIFVHMFYYLYPREKPEACPCLISYYSILSTFPHPLGTCIFLRGGCPKGPPSPLQQLEQGGHMPQ